MTRNLVLLLCVFLFSTLFLYASDAPASEEKEVDVSEYYLPDRPFDWSWEKHNHLFINMAAEKFKDPEMLNMPYHRDDRCHQGMIGPSMENCFDVNRPETYNLAGPDENFMGWKDVKIAGFRSNARAIIEAGKQPPKTFKVAWLGNIRSPAPGVPEVQTRLLLPEFTANYSDLFHFYHIHPVDIEHQPHYMTQADMVREFAYLMDIGGNGWSGRLKWLLFSHRPILVVDRPYQDYFHRDLQPFVHFIPVKRDLSDLVSQTLWVKQHPQECATIAENAFRFAAENFRDEKLLQRVHEVYEYIKAHHPDAFTHPRVVAHPGVNHVVVRHQPPPPPAHVVRHQPPPANHLHPPQN